MLAFPGTTNNYSSSSVFLWIFSFNPIGLKQFTVPHSSASRNGSLWCRDIAFHFSSPDNTFPSEQCPQFRKTADFALHVNLKVVRRWDLISIRRCSYIESGSKTHAYYLRLDRHWYVQYQHFCQHLKCKLWKCLKGYLTQILKFSDYLLTINSFQTN